MSDNKSNTEHLHEEGVINKDDLDDNHVKALDSLSKEEIESLKSIDKNMKKNNPSVGIVL